MYWLAGRRGGSGKRGRSRGGRSTSDDGWAEMVGDNVILYGCVCSTGTGTVISDLPVREGPLFQYGSFICTRNSNPNPNINPSLNAIHTWSSYARVSNANSDEFEHFSYNANSTNKLRMNREFMYIKWLPCLLVFRLNACANA